MTFVYILLSCDIESQDSNSRQSLEELDLYESKKELNIQYEHLEKFGLSTPIEFDKSEQSDTIPTCLVKWDKYLSSTRRTKQRIAEESKLAEWLKVRLQLDTTQVLNY